MSETNDDTGAETLFDQLVRLARKGEWKALDQVAQAAMVAWGEDRLSDSELEYVTAIVRARRRGEPLGGAAREPKARSPDTQVGSRPRSSRSLARRRHYLSIGLLPDSFLGGARWGIFAVLAFIARIVMERGRCTLFVDEIAARTGYGSSTVQEALRFARLRGWLAIDYRRPDGQRRNLANVVTVAAPEWLTWLRQRAATWRGLTKAGRAFWNLGSNFARATSTRDRTGVGLTPDNTDAGASSTPERAAERQTARAGPSRPPRVAPA